MPKVPTSAPGPRLVDLPPPPDETSLAMAAAMMRDEGRLFEQGKDILKQRMGGEVPWYKQKQSPDLGMALQAGDARDIQEAVRGKDK